ncbi:hypothetical protein HYX11_04805 [Candidatus Woesearchaeota archaeon]|nr:hypothetical protein [Candidatus Woesearchaeota archaeon]
MNLEQIIVQKLFGIRMLPLISVISLYAGNGCGVQEPAAQNASLGQYCLTDSTCDGQFVCENQHCVSGKGGYCLNDGNCSGVYICQNNRCILGSNNRNDTNNINNNQTNTPSPFPTAKTPQEAYSLFKEALQNNELNGALKYISPHVQNKYKDFFSKINLTELAQAMPLWQGMSPSYQSPTLHFWEYNIIVKGEEFPIIVQCDNHDACTIRF